jgi:hypothetical protein
MKLFEFNKMDAVNKFDTLCRCGELLGERISQGAKVLLYQIDAFYVEVYYVASLNKIDKMRSFGSTNHLKPYLEEIDISCLISKY